MAHALILGASGISGWAVLNQTCDYPSPSAFARITGTTNRPLTLEKAGIPYDDRIRLVSGVDFTKSVDEVVAQLKAKISDVNTVTHVFFTGKISAHNGSTCLTIHLLILNASIHTNQ
jgi:hypothetical protein